MESEKQGIYHKLGKENFAFNFYFLIVWYCALMSVLGSGSIFGDIFGGFFFAMMETWLYIVGMYLNILHTVGFVIVTY